MISRRLVPAVAAVALVLASCGGSDAAEETPVTDAPAPTVAADEPEEDFSDAQVSDGADVDSDSGDVDGDGTDAGADETPAPAEADEPEPAESGSVSDAAAAGSVSASLVEWAIEAPTEYAAGEVTFTAANNGSFPHELVVIQGESYESLPLAEGGAVVEDDLPTGALIGRTARLGGGSSEDLTVTLAPGNYVLVCNLGGGSSSHAGQGQRLDITVS